MNKDIRIHSLQPDIVNGYVLFDVYGQDLLKEELEQYPFCAHKDGLDALQQCYSMVDRARMEPSPGMTNVSAYRFGDDAETMLPQADPYAEMERAAVQNEFLQAVQDEAERAANEGRPAREIAPPEPYFPIAFM